MAGIFLSLFALVRPFVKEASVLFNDPLFALVFSAALVLFVSYWLGEQKRLGFVVLTLAIAFALGFGFKAFFHEQRPCVSLPAKIECPTDYSLPSVHSLLAFTLVIGAIGNRSFAIYLIYAIFIAISRVYLGVHTISDIAAGLALAFFACVLAEMLYHSMKWPLPNQVKFRHALGRK